MTAKTKATNPTAKKRASLKRNFIEILGKKAGNITETCRAVNIDRATYYDWIKKDADFAEKCDAVKESLLDFMESQLLKNIQAGKEASLIFALKCQGKRRGYVERQQIEHSGETKVVVYGDEG